MSTSCMESTARLYGGPNEVPPVQNGVEADHLVVQGDLLREVGAAVPLVPVVALEADRDTLAHVYLAPRPPTTILTCHYWVMGSCRPSSSFFVGPVFIFTQARFSRLHETKANRPNVFVCMNGGMGSSGDLLARLRQA